MPQPIFDPHVHLIDLHKGHYQWLRNADNTWLNNVERIKKSFTELDLKLPAPFELRSVTHIEAGFDNANPERELSFISNNSTTIPLVSYLALDSDPELFESKLSLLMLFDSLVGIRDISESNDYQRLQSKNVIDNLTLLAQHKLIFEAQFNVDIKMAVELFCTIAKKLPTLTIIVNHSGFPTESNFCDWQQGIKKLSKLSNILIKFCGFEMSNNPVDEVFKQRILDIILRKFSENRVMFASNFPLCLTQKSYHQVWKDYYHMQLTPDVWRKLSYVNAKQIYSI